MDIQQKLEYHQLIYGEIYKSYFAGQGWYVIKHGENGYIRLEDKYYHAGVHNVIPSNGFKEFYPANEQERQQYLKSKETRKYTSIEQIYQEPLVHF